MRAVLKRLIWTRIKNTWIGKAFWRLKMGVKNHFERIDLFQNRYIPEDFSATVLFTNDSNLFQDYQIRRSLSEPRVRRKVTLISTVFNEMDNLSDWVDAIKNQTRQPDEIIIVDGGSSDGTYENLIAYSKTSRVPFKIIRAKNSNIAQGRNIAIQAASHEIIAATDFGGRPEANWLEFITAPFEIDPDIGLVAGWYDVRNRKGKKVGRRAFVRMDQVDPNTYIPSSRSIAFTKSAWAKAGRYPEWFTLTGEDTYFAYELRKKTQKRAFVPEAVVTWIAPVSWISHWKKIYSWSVGDGESGLNGTGYWNVGVCISAGILLSLLTILLVIFLSVFSELNLILIIFGLVLALVCGIILISKKFKIPVQNLVFEIVTAAAQFLGFLKGVKNRKKIDLKRFQESKGIFIVLAGVPLHDTGGGSRGAQLAREFVNQGYVVFYIHKFDSYESKDVGLSYAHPNLISRKFNNFSWEEFESRYKNLLKTKPLNCIIEFPLPDFLPLIDNLKRINATIIYDLLDAWDTQLGSSWYRKEANQQIVNKSDYLIATAPVLQTFLESITDKKVHLLPNAVNHKLFNFRRILFKPENFPDFKKTIIYIGALWGEWFDWNLLIKIAREFPEYAVLVIGDYRGQCPESLENLIFLGLKPQNVLPQYLKFSDVAIIPWKVNKITEATSPLKLYENLAMHVPTVTPNLPLLKDIPAVYLSIDETDFINNIKKALNSTFDEELFETYVKNNSWESRVNYLLNLLERS